MLQAILNIIPDWIEAACIAVTAASIVAASTTTPKGDSLVANLYKVVNIMAINFGKAKS